MKVSLKGTAKQLLKQDAERKAAKDASLQALAEMTVDELETWLGTQDQDTINKLLAKTVMLLYRRMN